VLAVFGVDGTALCFVETNVNGVPPPSSYFFRLRALLRSFFFVRLTSPLHPLPPVLLKSFHVDNTAAMAASASLLIYLNSDVGLEQPYRTTLPASVDTLAELCQFLTSRIPPRPGEDTTGRGYRFLYSVQGKPLWRVKECLDAGTIVLSVGPGFLARRPTAITNNTSASTTPLAAAAADPAATTNLVDLTTPDRLAATSRGSRNTDQPRVSANKNTTTNVTAAAVFQADASPSASPPVKIPAEGYFYAEAAGPAPSDGRPSADPLDGGATDLGAQRTSTNAAFVREGVRDSVDAAWPPAPSVRRPSQTDERDRLVSITLNTAARGTRASSGGPFTQSTPFTPGAEATAAEAAGVVGSMTPAVRLFTPPGAPTTATAAATTRAFQGNPPQNEAAMQPTAPPSQPHPGLPMSSTIVAGGVPRGMVFLAHETHVLPPRPAFATAATALTATLPLLQPLPSTSISRCLQFLLMRKWGAYQKLHSMPPADLIAGEALSRQFSAITSACSAWSNSSTDGAVSNGAGGSRACRVVVSGPPRSGVSTTAAFLLRHFLRTLQFQPQHHLHNTLLIPLDFQLLFGLQVMTTSGGQALLQQPPPRVLLDLASLYQLVVRTVMDAVVAQRPALREAGPLLSQLWDLVIKPNVEPKIPPNFTAYAQAAALVGGDVLARWTRLAEQVFPILQAACRTPEVPQLRDAALDLIFYAIPAEVAASLNFSGLLYAIDGAETLTHCYAERVTRPLGDLGPLLQALSADARTHLLLAWPSTMAPRLPFVPNLTAHVSTVGLVTRAALDHLHFPQLIRSGRRDYPVEAFLGCPGYLTCLYAVVRPFRTTPTTPTTAYSSYYPQHYEQSAADAYAVRIDSSEVSQAMDQLLAIVKTLPTA
jgi:hypothetical protein